jgi:hypothetical protein
MNVNRVLRNRILGCLTADTILLRNQEQNRPFQSKSSLTLISMNYLQFLFFFVGILSLGGCAPKETTAPDSSIAISNQDRPPLVVWLVDAPELEKELAIRWQANSDQPLQIENIASDDLAKSKSFAVDLIVFPGHLMGDLIQKGAIGRLPTQAIAKTDSEPAEEWPVRWRNIASYGGQLMAIPLGAPPLGAIARGTDLQPLVEIERALSNVRDLNTLSILEWGKLLDRFENAIPKSVRGATDTLETKIAKLNSREKHALVERFLWIVSTSDARRRGLFDLVKMEARLQQPEFVASAKTLARLSIAFPHTMLEEPNQAWNAVRADTSGKIAFAIGSPSSKADTTELLETEAKENCVVSPWIWNANHGLVAAVGKNTRQTAVSCKFLQWLSEADQREALRPLCPRIELLPSQSDRNAARSDYREFQTVVNRSARPEGMELSLRMANANQYREILAESLILAIRSPDQIETIMSKCSSEWNALTNNLGKEAQRLSEEQSMGYQK